MFHVEQKEIYIEVQDHFLTKENFQIQKTNTQGLLQTLPSPSKSQIRNYYKSEHYVSHDSKKSSFFFFFYRFFRAINFLSKKRLLPSEKLCKNVLDFGSGEGYFIDKLRRKGFNVFGVDTIKSDVSKGVYESVFDKNLQTKKFNCITAWHSIEHVHELDKTISRFYDLLDDKGALIIAVPNYLSLDAKHYNVFWAGYDVPRHLWHFDKRSLIKLFESKGFDFIKSKPMLLDAYYVSLLSEEYKKSTFKLFKSFIVGTLSNINAFFTKEYSSNIFVFKKSG